ncbi:MAG TPA: glycosyltransferase family A protein [Candidatus Omnitrophota bacterium]|nr:glycosyltransferase family A protein [Candidatus Omnitrophota bacterium]HPD85176.1 glycosyltransferase family A protein [Candidatus Omnitrophota bacterium]HRZ04323.1 glycosyltransferase family A protein [Candidatus Omnitrophota bacterium]
MTTPPKVSVIMGVYNGERFIREAIDSVIAQTCSDWELVVVDDGSKDRIAKIVKEYQDRYPDKIRYYFQENQGAAGAKNAGIGYARGEYVAILDSDDIFMPEKLGKQVRFLDSHSNVAFLWTAGWKVGPGGKVFERSDVPTDNQDIKARLLKENPFIHSSFMFRKSALESFGYYRDDIALVDDYELYLRGLNLYDFAALNEPLCKQRFHLESLSVTQRAQQARAAEALRGFAKDKDIRLMEEFSFNRNGRTAGMFTQRSEKASNYFHWAVRLREGGDQRNSFLFLLRALALKPANIEIWRFALGMFFVKDNQFKGCADASTQTRK